MRTATCTRILAQVPVSACDSRPSPHLTGNMRSLRDGMSHAALLAMLAIAATPATPSATRTVGREDWRHLSRKEITDIAEPVKYSEVFVAEELICTGSFANETVGMIRSFVRRERPVFRRILEHGYTCEGSTPGGAERIAAARLLAISGDSWAQDQLGEYLFSADSSDRDLAVKAIRWFGPIRDRKVVRRLARISGEKDQISTQDARELLALGASPEVLAEIEERLASGLVPEDRTALEQLVVGVRWWVEYEQHGPVHWLDFESLRGHCPHRLQELKDKAERHERLAAATLDKNPTSARTDAEYADYYRQEYAYALEETEAEEFARFLLASGTDVLEELDTRWNARHSLELARDEVPMLREVVERGLEIPSSPFYLSPYFRTELEVGGRAAAASLLVCLGDRWASTTLPEYLQSPDRDKRHAALAALAGRSSDPRILAAGVASLSSREEADRAVALGVLKRLAPVTDPGAKATVHSLLRAEDSGIRYAAASAVMSLPWPVEDEEVIRDLLSIADECRLEEKGQACEVWSRLEREFGYHAPPPLLVREIQARTARQPGTWSDFLSQLSRAPLQSPSPISPPTGDTREVLPCVTGL